MYTDPPQGVMRLKLEDLVLFYEHVPFPKISVGGWAPQNSRAGALESWRARARIWRRGPIWEMQMHRSRAIRRTNGACHAAGAQIKNAPQGDIRAGSRMPPMGHAWLPPPPE